jgi:hypothetical protein
LKLTQTGSKTQLPQILLLNLKRPEDHQERDETQGGQFNEVYDPNCPIVDVGVQFGGPL